jgi:hypothetical protein
MNTRIHDFAATFNNNNNTTNNNVSSQFFNNLYNLFPYHQNLNANDNKFSFSNVGYTSSLKSPALTPGRKSASPTFFHSKSSSQNFVNNSEPYFASPDNQPPSSRTTNSNNNFLNFNSKSAFMPINNEFSQSFNYNRVIPKTPKTPITPNTPSRSRSLSPATARNNDFFQMPPIIRYKQKSANINGNAISSYSTIELRRNDSQLKKENRKDENVSKCKDELKRRLNIPLNLRRINLDNLPPDRGLTNSKNNNSLSSSSVTK